jgi:glutaminyl-tRNA synthetase
MASPNMNMRDPVIYRIIHAKHHRQGNKWCIYPMYDFAHPIQDALEGISHSLCSIEFENHRPLYDWVIDNIGIEKKPHQYEFARLNMTYTVMSKRYLRKLVETKVVDGWDDPRMPTLCGLRRRGYTPSSIFKFISRSGVSKTNSMTDVRFLEYCICEELNETALRRIAIMEPLKVKITNYPDGKTEYFEMPNHPKKPELGKRKMPFTNEIYIEKSDFSENPPPGFKRLVPGGEVRLMESYILKCNDVVRNSRGDVEQIICTVGRLKEQFIGCPPPTRRMPSLGYITTCLTGKMLQTCLRMIILRNFWPTIRLLYTIIAKLSLPLPVLPPVSASNL